MGALIMGNLSQPFGQTRSYEYPDHKGCLIELTQGQDHSHFAERIKISIDSLVKMSEFFIRILNSKQRKVRSD
jgi:hypothetical protein